MYYACVFPTEVGDNEACVACTCRSNAPCTIAAFSCGRSGPDGSSTDQPSQEHFHSVATPAFQLDTISRGSFINVYSRRELEKVNSTEVESWNRW